jgi:hypothetical protein
VEQGSLVLPKSVGSGHRLHFILGDELPNSDRIRPFWSKVLLEEIRVALERTRSSFVSGGLLAVLAVCGKTLAFDGH